MQKFVLAAVLAALLIPGTAQAGKPAPPPTTSSSSEMCIGSSFLAALNSGDETPGAPTFGTWGSPCDEIINPDSSVPLGGATDTQTACLSHSDLYGDATVYGQVREFVR